ncbi:unnamed protein product [Protopolystoma xenopodis]|uniref:C2H2-type domain-containing protein n=1 Tax=Protopolystoma xenopodis TaxID=117903 RepID=A0A448X3B5_9PLAT|nr:unnamed protein product [Protopolystoma xenopodis]
MFQCPLCPRREIETRARLTQHLQEHQSTCRRDDGKHVCCFCGSELSSNSSLERHLLTHTSEHARLLCQPDGRTDRFAIWPTHVRLYVSINASIIISPRFNLHFSQLVGLVARPAKSGGAGRTDKTGSMPNQRKLCTIGKRCAAKAG